MGVVELNIMQGPYTDLLNILGYSTDDAFDDDEDYINACLHHPRIVQAKIRAL